MRQWIRRARVQMTAVLLALVAFGALSPIAPVVGQTPGTPTPVPVVWAAFEWGLAIVWVWPGDGATYVGQVSDWVNDDFRGLAVAADDERRLVWLLTDDPAARTSRLLSAYL